MKHTHSNPLISSHHPLLVPDGYQINTKPTERLANFIRKNIFEGHHGCSAYGGGGVGKTTAIAYLTDNAPAMCSHRSAPGRRSWA